MVNTEQQAVELRARIIAGDSFEALAREFSRDPSARAGGFMRGIALSGLREELRTALLRLVPGQISPVLQIGSEFFLLQLVQPTEAQWVAENAAALEFLQGGRVADAAQSFLKAVQIAATFGADDDRLGQSLNGLREAYIGQEDFADAAAVSRRILAIRWSGQSNKGDPAVADLVDHFADVLRLSYFRGSEFEEALKRYQGALSKTPVNEALYLAMSSILIKAELTAEASTVMQRAIQAFPDSRRVRYKEAEMYRDSGRMQKALETFRQASQMKPPPSMPRDLDTAQLSFIYQRIGGISTDLVQFEGAIAAYKKALEISPENADARIALGDLYLRRGQPTEALAEYSLVLQMHSDKALPHYRAADANLQMGNFAEAAEAAARALKIDPQLRGARYVYGTALVRTGRTEEGENELQAYRKQEADAQTQINDQRDVLVSSRGAAALVLEGHGEEAIASFRTGIEGHPQAAALRLNYGVALGILGQHREAAATLQTLLNTGIKDDFLVLRCLAHEYEMIKDEKTSQKYTALYIRKVDAALEEELR